MLSVTAHTRVTGSTVLATFREAAAVYGVPASTLTDNGMVFTTRNSDGKGGRNGFETELRRLGVRQINGAPNHPQTQGKVCEDLVRCCTGVRSDPGQGVTRVSCVRCVGWLWCSAVACTGQTDLT